MIEVKSEFCNGMDSPITTLNNIRKAVDNLDPRYCPVDYAIAYCLRGCTKGEDVIDDLEYTIGQLNIFLNNYKELSK